MSYKRRSIWELLKVLFSSGSAQEMNNEKLAKELTKSEDKEQHSPSESINDLVCQEVLKEARAFIGTHYKYAGNNPAEGFDCSGLVYRVFKNQGIELQRSSHLQANEGNHVEIKEVKPGDLIFFSHSGDKINHVGIVSSIKRNHLKMIHSSSSKGVIESDVSQSDYWKNW